MNYKRMHLNFIFCPDIDVIEFGSRNSNKKWRFGNLFQRTLQRQEIEVRLHIYARWATTEYATKRSIDSWHSSCGIMFVLRVARISSDLRV